MEVWMIVAVIVELITAVIAATAIQRDRDDGKAFLIAVTSFSNIFIIGGVLFYYMWKIYPIVHGR